MKFFILLITLVIISSWIGLSLLLLGHIQIEGIQLELPKSMASFGDASGILNGVFSSFAVILALITVLFQGKELRESTAAQNEQSQSLKEQLQHQQKITKSQLERSQAIMSQLEQQQVTNKILILQAKQQYHSSEISRMDSVLDKLDGDFSKQKLYNNCISKKKEHVEHLKDIENDFKKLK